MRSSGFLVADEVTTVDGLRCTSEGRTLWDLARSTDLELLERFAYDLGRRRRRRALWIAARLASEHRGAPGSARLREALGGLPSGLSLLGSVLEADGIRSLRAAGLAPPVLQYVVRDGDGARVKRVDAAWPEHLVCLEFDGALYHDTTKARGADELTRNDLAALGWRVVIVRAQDLRGQRFEDLTSLLKGLLGQASRR